MNRIVKLMPEISGKEFEMMSLYTKDLDDEQFETVAHVYRSRRRNPQDVLILALVGLFVIPGLQRFYVNQIGMGVLYLFTVGLCFIGSIMDIINYENLAQEYNRIVLDDAIILVRRI